MVEFCKELIGALIGDLDALKVKTLLNECRFIMRTYN